MRITATETVKASPDRVFDVFSDVENCGDRIQGIIKLELLSDVRSGKGVRWRETRKFMGKEATEEMEITVYDEPKYYVVEAESNGTHYTSRYAFEESGDGTRVIWEFEGKPLTLAAKLMSPLGFLFKGSLKKLMFKDVADLKRYIES